MLIGRKLTKNKRIMTDFRHLNVRITKNNLTYPLLKDTFLVLGSSRCEILLVLVLKDAFHSLGLSENSKNYWKNTPLFWQDIVSISDHAYGIKHIPSIWQSYINAILNNLQSKNIVKQSWMIFYCLLPQLLIWQNLKIYFRHY